MNRLIVQSFLGLILVCSCGAGRSKMLLSSQENTRSLDVQLELLDEEVSLNKNDFVFVTAPQLNIRYKDIQGVEKQFHKNIQKIFNAKYSGMSIAAVKDDASVYTWNKKINVFIARYGKDYTASWRPSGETPDQPDWAYLDSRRSVSDLKVLHPVSDHPYMGNLRILGARIRTGYSSEGYSYNQALILLYLDPKTGAKKTVLYADPRGKERKLYLIPTITDFPAKNSDASIVNIISAADTTRGIGQGDPPVLDVPFHNYVSESFRFFGAQSLQGSEKPYGEPILNLANGSDLAVVHKAMENILKYDPNSQDFNQRVISDEDYKAILNLFL